ncbi:MAG: cobalamin B12-binding domain-containing protein [Aminivibrio sp.]|jgi:methanogenic corrinoid protein MtbC1|nr:cobalamin-binding protein [Synergistaceae bacterium]
MTERNIRAERFEAALLSLDRLEAARLLESGGDDRPFTLRIEQDVAPAMESIGRAWEEGRIALSQVYMSGRICEELINRHLPKGGGGGGAGLKIALALLEDRHFLGKRMVGAVLSAAGYPFLDYGAMDSDSLVRRAADDGLDLLLISTLMLPSALKVEKVRKGLDSLGLGVKIAVGGAPFRLAPDLWREVGADAMGRNASEAISIIKSFTGGAGQ